MGKQSRKKSSKKGSKEHKAKLRERREKRDEYVDNNNNNNNNNDNDNPFVEDNNDEYANVIEDGNNNHYYNNDNDTSINEQTILEGDRVWIVCSKEEATMNDKDGLDDPGLRRGVVKKISDSDDTVYVQPFAFLRVGNDTTWPILKKNLLRDILNLTTEFDVGDKVVCETGDGWMPGVVTYLWPVWECKSVENYKQGRVPYYEIKVYPSMAGIMDTDPCNVASPYEDERAIRKHPSVFRFSIGDSVVFDSSEAHCLSKKNTNHNGHIGWIIGRISAVDIFMQHKYGVYECTVEEKEVVVAKGGRDRGRSKGKFKGNLISTYLIWKDEDQYIALANNNPRDRLFDAISQDCSYEHIDYLINGFSIDASLIQELVVQ